MKGSKIDINQKKIGNVRHSKSLVQNTIHHNQVRNRKGYFIMIKNSVCPKNDNSQLINMQ
jgi:hypothetical protein